MNLKEHYSYMKKQGLDQKRISKELGWTQSQVSKFLNNPIKCKLSIYDLIRIKTIFQFSDYNTMFKRILNN